MVRTRLLKRKSVIIVTELSFHEVYASELVTLMAAK